MWTQENRARYDRSKLTYPSNLTDAEWALIGPLIPPAKSGEHSRTASVRDILNGITLRAEQRLPVAPCPQRICLPCRYWCRLSSG